jgi:hypothetical protein
MYIAARPFKTESKSLKKLWLENFFMIVKQKRQFNPYVAHAFLKLSLIDFALDYNKNDF